MGGQMVAFEDERMALEVRSQVNQLQYLLKNVLKEGEHYGTIPGVDKPTLFQSGAEKICYMLKLVPHYDTKMTPIEGMPWHREYMVTCTLSDENGVVRGEAVASCSTMESRYRWRRGFEDTGDPIPQDSKERKQEYARQGLGMKKVGNQWKWVRYIDKQENPDIADTWNTVLQMAQKRAFVRATRSTAAASDIFTQDIEDIPEWARGDYPQGMDVAQRQETRPVEQERPSEQETSELRTLAARLVEAGYDQRQAKGVVWDAYKSNGIDGARARVEDMIEPEYETDEIDF